jgi:dTDP-glucose pyrophosphorylase
VLAELPTIRDTASIREAMRAIDIGTAAIALVVDGDQRLVGTVTDGDVRRALLRGAGLDSLIKPIMNRGFVAVRPATPRAEVLDVMRVRTLAQVPIVDESGRLVGLHLLREIVGGARRPNWAVVMAGGRGERLRPLTDSLPKPMIPVAGRPILERIVLHLVGFGLQRIFMAVHYMADVIEEHFGDGGQFGCRIEYLREDVPLGTGGALSLLPEQPRHPLLVLNGDLLTQVDIGALLDHHVSSQARATVAVFQHRYVIPLGVVETNAEGRVQTLSEKPTKAWLVNAGIYVVEPELVSRVPPGVATPMPAVIEESLDRGELVAAYHLEDDWIDVGLPHELKRARGEAR